MSLVVMSRRAESGTRHKEAIKEARGECRQDARAKVKC